MQQFFLIQRIYLVLSDLVVYQWRVLTLKFVLRFNAPLVGCKNIKLTLVHGVQIERFVKMEVSPLGRTLPMPLSVAEI